MLFSITLERENYLFSFSKAFAPGLAWQHIEYCRRFFIVKIISIMDWLFLFYLLIVIFPIGLRNAWIFVYRYRDRYQFDRNSFGGQSDWCSFMMLVEIGLDQWMGPVKSKCGNWIPFQRGYRGERVFAFPILPILICDA